jgi:hypothetical protein
MWFSGGKFGVVINNTMMIGLGGYSLENSSPFEYSSIENENQNYLFETEIEYGGLVFEYTFFKESLVHIVVPVLIGTGDINIKQNVSLNKITAEFPEDFESTYSAEVENSSIGVFEPGVNLEVELASWIRFDIGASYRYVFGSNLSSLPQADHRVSGTSLDIGIKFGCF